MHTEYYWTFRIESSRYYGEMDSDSLGFITEENKEAWLRFIQNKISELMKPETMDSKEFKECLAKVQEEKRKREEYDRREKELRKLIEGAFMALVDSVKAWNNEEKRHWVNDFISKEVSHYHDFKGLQKVMLQMMPSSPLVGEPIEVVREKSEEDLLMYTNTYVTKDN